jgi:hypothetical protein
MISLGNLRQGDPGHTGIFQLPQLHTWSEGHGSFKSNVLTSCTAKGPANHTTFQSTGPRAGILKLEYCTDFLCHSNIILICVSTMPCKEGVEAMNARDKRKIRYDVRNMTPSHTSLEKNPVDFKLFGEISDMISPFFSGAILSPSGGICASNLR